MIKLKQLLREWDHNKRPSKDLDLFILKNHVHVFNGTLYHGSPMDGLKEMIIQGIHGSEHGEIAEYDAFSTSINFQVLRLFSEGHGNTGLEFDAKGINVVVLDDFLHKLMVELPGSGMEVDVDEEEFKAFCQKYGVPRGAWNKDEYYLPHDYLSSLGVDAFTFEYVWKRVDMPSTHNDESEIAILSKGIQKINGMVDFIWVDGHSFEIKEKEEALKAIDLYDQS